MHGSGAAADGLRQRLPRAARAGAHRRRLARRANLFRFPRLAPVPVNPQVLSQSFTQNLRACYALTKPRVVSLIVFTAVIGMLLATPGVVPIQILIAGTAGIALVAGAAAAINCLVEQKIDAVMQRTRWRPLPRGELTVQQTLAFTAAIGGLGLWLLYRFVNPLTMWLTVATFIG